MPQKLSSSDASKKAAPRMEIPYQKMEKVVYGGKVQGRYFYFSIITFSGQEFSFALIDDEKNIKKWVDALNIKLRMAKKRRNYSDNIRNHDSVEMKARDKIEESGFSTEIDSELEADEDCMTIDDNKGKRKSFDVGSLSVHKAPIEIEGSTYHEAAIYNSFYHNDWQVACLFEYTRIFCRVDDRSSLDLSRWIDFFFGPKQIKAQCSINAKPNHVFHAVMDISNDTRSLWDTSFKSGNVVKILDSNNDIVSIQLRNPYKAIMPNIQLVLSRHWRRESDGTYKLLYRSTDTSEEITKPKQASRCASMTWGFITISPKVSRLSKYSCVVTYGMCLNLPGVLGWCKPLSDSYIHNIVGQSMASLRKLLEGRKHDNLMNALQSSNVAEQNGKELKKEKHLIGSDTTSPNDDGSCGADNANLDYSYHMPENNYIYPKDITKDGVSCWWDSGVEEGFWNVRGHNYLEDSIKIPSVTSAMELLQIQWSFYDEPKRNIANDPGELVQMQHAGRNDRPFLFVINFMVPTIGNWVCYFTKRRGTNYKRFDKMLKEFINGDDEFRNSKFKIIPNVVEGSYFASRAIGSKPAILGTKITTNYYRGDNWFEVCVDIGSSRVAGTLMGIVKSYATSLVIDLAFLFESQTYEELPEIILGGCRIYQPLMYPCEDPLQYIKSKEHLERALGKPL
eukprot:CAMPEP_0204875178 /NCGR_PEP_ID=MMETSP1348-20121228/45245_1 /ASSEMBLY_ACC=CAM_ASM_000700 /TAXON_ID=215587 /ORGANISM="Aplanochytrium stocchinoi, Strain GSBS06" /LENGTH=677 /DNA_ID=CAMNT_0052031465 /DNA_START=13 /DNA_END=2046 /DNA_ORIENTATION=-